MYYYLPNWMQTDFTSVKLLLSQLHTNNVSWAEAQLVELCNSQQGLQYLYLILTQDNVAVQTQYFIISVINRLIVAQKMQMSEEFVEEYLIRFMMDDKIDRRHKLAIQRSLSFCIRKYQNFQQIVLTTSKNIISSLNATISQNNIYEKDIKQLIINQSTTLISLGHSIFSLNQVLQQDNQSEEDKQENKKGCLSQYQYQFFLEIPIIKYITQFLSQLEEFHKCLFKLQNITDFMDILKGLFELLLQIIEENFNNKLMRIMFMPISNWAHLSQLFMKIYLQNIIKEDKQRSSITNNKKRVLQSLKYQVSLFHLSIADFLIQSNDEKGISLFITPFLPLISQTIIHYNPLVHTEYNKQCQNFTFLLQDYYIDSKQTSIEQMMHIFQSLILPILDKILASFRGIHFIEQPSILYEKFQDIRQYQIVIGSILNSLVEILYKFINLDDGFSVYLFQLIRRSFEINYQAYGKDDWNCPEYITDHDAHSLKAYDIFFIMAMMEFSGQINTPIAEYFRSILSVSLIQKMDDYSSGVMYFFLQHYYLNIYDNNIKQGLFLFYNIFDANINSSTEYFANKFIHNMSDTIVDVEFIMCYVKKLQILRDLQKWQIVQKWMNLSTDYSRKSNIRLALSLINSTKNKINDEGDCQELKYYLSVLAVIVENLILKTRIGQLIQDFLELCLILVNRFTRQTTKKAAFHLIRKMIKILPLHQRQIFGIIHLVLKDNTQSSSQNSSYLYLLIASSLPLFTDKQHLLKIYNYCFGFIEKIKDIPTISQDLYKNKFNIKNANEIYQQISNALFILQAYLVKHSILDNQFTHSICAKAKNLKKYLSQQIQQQLRNQLYNILYSRCIVIEMYFCVLSGDNDIDYDQIERETSRKNFKDYDAMMLIQQLILLYPKMLKEIQQKTIYIIRNILQTMIQWQKMMDEQSNRRKLLKKFFIIPNKASSLITQSKNALESIKKWMLLLQIKDFRQLSLKLDNIPFAMIEQMRLMFKALSARQIKRQRCQQQQFCTSNTRQYRKQSHFKRKRPNHFDAEQSNPEKVSNPNETFRKIRKTILEQPQNIKSITDSIAPSNESQSNKSATQQPNSLDSAPNDTNLNLFVENPHNNPKEDDKDQTHEAGQTFDYTLYDRIALLYIEKPLEEDSRK